MKKNHVNIPIFIPHRGCGFNCIFCNQKKISGQDTDMTVERMIKQIDVHLKTAANGSEVEIAFFGGSFTGMDKDLQIRFLSCANEYVKQNKVKGIRLSTRPDYISEDILKYLKKYNVKIIELGVQSLDNDVLKLSNRGHGVKEVYKAVELIKKSGIALGIQTMVGLPGDTREKDILTAKKVSKMDPVCVRIYPTLVVRDTVLESMYKLGKYKPLSLEEAVLICSDILEIYRENKICVIRVGLQPSDNMNEQNDVVGGPFHPAFRQLVESCLMRRKIEDKLKGYDNTKNKILTITTGEKNISNIVGHGKSNIYYLKNKFNFESVLIKPDNCKNNDFDLTVKE